MRSSTQQKVPPRTPRTVYRTLEGWALGTLIENQAVTDVPITAAAKTGRILGVPLARRRLTILLLKHHSEAIRHHPLKSKQPLGGIRRAGRIHRI
jgi:hypothetical protein